MSRLMSVSFTEQAVRERRKTVTRRKGWWVDKNGRRLLHPGDRLTLCRKVMGRKPGEPLERICEVEVVSVHREPLHFVQCDGELTKEGFPELEPVRVLDGWGTFVRRYFMPQGIGPSDLVTRIEWRYLDQPAEQ
jgi:hypothetical protein